MKLCYADDSWAYFTDQPLTGENCQWGDDWNDVPWEHNAGTPYTSSGEKIVKVAWEGPFELPGDYSANSPYSVEMINAGAVAWLIRDRHESGPMVVIPAGVSVEEFIEKIESCGGKVYQCK